MRKLNLEKLMDGLPGLSKSAGAYFEEAAVYCLEKNGHISGIEIIISGDFSVSFCLVWQDDILTEQVNRTWKNHSKAAELGAIAIAILLILELTEFTILEIAEYGTRVDFILGDASINDNEIYNYEPAGVLEVSGIWEESQGNTINMRIGIKKRQTEKANWTSIPIFIVVTEFKTPKTKIIKQ